jgi:hypothetical protein
VHTIVPAPNLRWLASTCGRPLRIQRAPTYSCPTWVYSTCLEDLTETFSGGPHLFLCGLIPGSEPGNVSNQNLYLPVLMYVDLSGQLSTSLGLNNMPNKLVSSQDVVLTPSNRSQNASKEIPFLPRLSRPEVGRDRVTTCKEGFHLSYTTTLSISS